MSRYLIDQIERNPRIIVTPRTQITALLGKDQLEGVELLDTSRQQTTAMAVRGLFVFIGAQPSTRWLAGQLAEDSRGFLLAGANIPEAQLDDRNRLPCSWKPARPGSSPSATSAAGQSSGQRPQSGKARWRCGLCSNASKPRELRSQTRLVPTVTAAMSHRRRRPTRGDFLRPRTSANGRHLLRVTGAWFGQKMRCRSGPMPACSSLAATRAAAESR